MTLFEQIKNVPKLDLHINLTSSISTDLAFNITNEPILDIEDKMHEKNNRDYLDSLHLPISILKKKENVMLCINDLITRLENNNILYTELFLDLPLYNKRFNLDNLINDILNVIENRNYHMNLVLCLSSKLTKEENLDILNLLDKYYLKGVSSVYFQKDKMDNLNDYDYIFSRLIKNSIPYIIDFNSKLTNNEREIYSNASRIIYSVSEKDNDLLDIVQEKNILLEFSISYLIENNVIMDIKDYLMYDLYKDNYLVTFTSRDMTTLNTDMLNEECLLFNSYPISMQEFVKMNINILMHLNIDNDLKIELINLFKEKSNDVL